MLITFKPRDRKKLTIYLLEAKLGFRHNSDGTTTVFEPSKALLSLAKRLDPNAKVYEGTRKTTIAREEFYKKYKKPEWLIRKEQQEKEAEMSMP